MRLSLFLCFLSIVSTFAQDSPAVEKSSAPQDVQRIAPAAEKKTNSEKQKTQTEPGGFNSLLNVSPQTGEERELHEAMETKLRSMNVGGSKAETEASAKQDDFTAIWEDLKLPLIIIGSLLVYFIPTLLGMRRNDFKKVFYINLLLGSFVVAGLVAMHFRPFPMQWLYIWAGVSWALALVPLFLKDCAPLPERERRRRHRSRRRSHG